MRGTDPPFVVSSTDPVTEPDVGSNDTTPAFTSSRRSPVTVPPVRVSLTDVGVVRKAAMISATDADGLAWRMMTAAPAT